MSGDTAPARVYPGPWCRLAPPAPAWLIPSLGLRVGLAAEPQGCCLWHVLPDRWHLWWLCQQCSHDGYMMAVVAMVAVAVLVMAVALVASSRHCLR